MKLLAIERQFVTMLLNGVWVRNHTLNLHETYLVTVGSTVFHVYCDRHWGYCQVSRGPSISIGGDDAKELFARADGVADIEVDDWDPIASWLNELTSNE